VLAVTFTALFAAGPAHAAAPVNYWNLAPGFISESWDSDGVPVYNGFSTPNPWGFYTAYLMSTNDKGQRTWRIENFLNSTRLGYQYGQGSTMYLFEGSQRALLVDTAQNTKDTPIVTGQIDLVTVVKQLLGHDNAGAVKANPVDFVVANTHNHPDHVGKNSALAPRTIFFPDGDWPNNAPANYVPIKEGGGPTTHGSGIAASSIDLGDRALEAIDVPGHTPGSVAYLDRDNQMIATGDAIGSAYVWGHLNTTNANGATSSWGGMIAHLQNVIAPYPNIAIFPAHFYQLKQFVRGQAPLNGRPLDPQYVADQRANAEGVTDGSKIGEPYREVGRNAVWVGGASARLTYSLANLYPGGIFGGNGDPTKYHAITIPGSYKLAAYQDAAPPGPAIDNIKTGFYLIRDNANTSMYLIKGSTRALLVGTGSGTPGIAAFARGLAGSLPLDVVVTSDDADQVGGLSQFAGSTIYGPAGVAGVTNAVGSGDVIDLGVDSAARPAKLEVQSLSGHSKKGLTLLDISDRALLSGDALGEQFNGGGLILHDTLERFDTALKAWRTKTDGRYDVVYTAHNYQWFTSPSYVDQVQQAVTLGLAGGATLTSTRPAGFKMVRSTGATDIVASIALAYAETNANGSVGGTVPATLALTLGAPATFGAFSPGLLKDYTASTTATVISSAGDATLTVSDPSTSANGHLVNGTFALPSPLQAAGSPLPATVKTWSAPTANEAVTVGFLQHIGVTDALRTGAYSKTLTFTLSTTAP
jgi:glyoxylase-like metal-dependent hydrolase (beta-lactamase superfamily II)